jgi:hypothetical protein
MRSATAGQDALVWRFRSPHHQCREFVMRTSEPKPHQSNKLPVSFDPKFANQQPQIMRTSGSGHWRCRAMRAIQTCLRILATHFVRVLPVVAPSKNRECRESRMQAAPVASHANEESIRVSSPQVRRNDPAFPARWFTAYSALSSETGLCLPPSPRALGVSAARPTSLDPGVVPSVGGTGPHAFAVRGPASLVS